MTSATGISIGCKAENTAVTVFRYRTIYVNGARFDDTNNLASQCIACFDHLYSQSFFSFVTKKVLSSREKKVALLYRVWLDIRLYLRSYFFESHSTFFHFLFTYISNLTNIDDSSIFLTKTLVHFQKFILIYTSIPCSYAN